MPHAARPCSPAKGNVRTATASPAWARAAARRSARLGGSRRAIELQRVDRRSERRHPIGSSARSRVMTRDGSTITGRLLNQDTFTVQVLDTGGRLRLLDKSTIREFAILKESPMPSYKDKLNAQEIADLVTYLTNAEGPTDDQDMRGFTCHRSRRSVRNGVVSGQVREWTTYSGDMLGQRHSPLTQITRRQRQEPRAAVGIPGALAGEVRGDAARGRRRHVHRAAAERRRRDGCGDRPCVLGLSRISRRRWRGSAAAA